MPKLEVAKEAVPEMTGTSNIDNALVENEEIEQEIQCSRSQQVVISRHIVGLEHVQSSASMQSILQEALATRAQPHLSVDRKQ